MRKIYKIIIYIIVILMLLQLIFIPIKVQALTNPIDNPENYKPTKPTGTSYDGIFHSARLVLGALQNIGIVVSVLAIMIVGVKYILGSVNEKAEYKQTLFPIVIGILLITSIITIINIIQNAVNSVF